MINIISAYYFINILNLFFFINFEADKNSDPFEVSVFILEAFGLWKTDNSRCYPMRALLVHAAFGFTTCEYFGL